MGVGLFGRQSKKGTGEKRDLGHREHPRVRALVASQRSLISELTLSTAQGREPLPPDRSSPLEDRQGWAWTFGCCGLESSGRPLHKSVHSTPLSQVGMN